MALTGNSRHEDYLHMFTDHGGYSRHDLRSRHDRQHGNNNSNYRGWLNNNMYASIDHVYYLISSHIRRLNTASWGREAIAYSTQHPP